MPVMQSPPGASTVIDGRRYVYFAGTGYLGLQGSEEVIRAACRAAELYGIGSATSRSGFGDTPPVLEVERRAAELFGADGSFYLVSGYVGNHVLVDSLSDSFDAVFVDESSHYCLIEAARLSGKPVFIFRHRDAGALADILAGKLAPGARPLVASDGVFAAVGRIAPVVEYGNVLKEFPGAILLIDDAHGLGVLGADGRGTYQHAGLWGEHVNDVSADPTDGPPQLFLSGTLSKAVGGFGGIIPGSKGFIDHLKTTSHYYNGASPPPVPAAAATAKALELVMADPSLRNRLRSNVRAVKAGLQEMGLDVDDSPVPIVCLTLGSAERMQRVQRELAERGLFVAYMPTYSGLGPEGALRLAVFSTHTDQMIERLLDELRKLV